MGFSKLDDFGLLDFIIPAFKSAVTSTDFLLEDSVCLAGDKDGLRNEKSDVVIVLKFELFLSDTVRVVELFLSDVELDRLLVFRGVNNSFGVFVLISSILFQCERIGIFETYPLVSVLLITRKSPLCALVGFGFMKRARGALNPPVLARLGEISEVNESL